MLSARSPSIALVFVIDDGPGTTSDPLVVYSASDLAAAARCEYALLRSFDARLGRGPAVAVEDELLARTAQLGDEHEQRHLDAIRATADATVTVIGRPKYTRAGLTAAADATRSAVERRAPIIYQAAMFDGRFAGFADFLLLDDDGRYRLRDTKLARSVKVEALLQLAAYAETLTAAGVEVAPEVELVLGDGAVAQYSLDELLPVYRPRRAALQHLLDHHLARDAPVSWEDADVRACFRCPECTAQVRAHDDLLLVAGMRVSQRARLIDAGITTVAQLAGHQGPVPELPSPGGHGAERAGAAADRRAGGRQAALRDRRSAAADGAAGTRPRRRVLRLRGRPALDGRRPRMGSRVPVRRARDRRHVHARCGRTTAHRSARRCWTSSTTVRKRRKRHPRMHVYHYAAYEKTALLRLAGRYGVGEDEVDDLLRNGVLVDLYPLVRKSIRVGTENYSLK